MSSRRLDRERIKIIETEPRAEGGQGIIVAGTMIHPEEIATWVPENFLKEFLEWKLAIKKLQWNSEDAEASAKFFKVNCPHNVAFLVLITPHQSFVNELSIMASISHSNIVKFVGFVEDMRKGDAWIVLPWEENGNVREFLASGEWDIPERISLVSVFRACYS